MDRKLYVVVRSDLSHGQQAVQACHAIRAFTQEHPEDRSDTIVLLAVPDEDSLCSVFRDAERLGADVEIFREPDIGDQATAVAISCEGRRSCRSLPLALITPPSSG